MKWLNKPKQILFYLFLASPFIFLTVFFYWPLFTILKSSILNENGKFTLDFLFNVVTDSLNRRFLIFTIVQALISVFCSMLLGLPGAYIFTKYRFRGDSILKSLVTVAFVLPPIVVVLGFLLAFGPNGIINNLWKEITGSNKPIFDIYKNFWGIILAHTFYNASVFIRVVGSGWEQLDPEYEDVAMTLGSTKRRIFFKITLPRLFPSLLAASILVFLYCFTSFTIVYAIGGIKYQTLETRIYTTFFRTPKYDNYINLTTALALIQLFICIFLSWFYAKQSEKIHGEKAGYTSIQRKVFLFSNMKRITKVKILSLGYIILLSGIILLPMLSILGVSLISDNGNITFKAYTDILSKQHNPFLGASPRSQIMNTLLFATCTMIGATILGLIAAFTLNNLGLSNKLRITTRRLIIIFILVPMAASNITFALGMLRTFGNTILNPKDVWITFILVHILVAFPFANRSINASLETQNPEFKQISATLGASRLRTFIRIELPLLIPGIIAAATFSFAISMGEFGATYFLSNPEYSTISVGIYRFIDMRQMQSAAAMAVLLMIVCTIAFLIVEKLGRTGRILG